MDSFPNMLVMCCAAERQHSKKSLSIFIVSTVNIILLALKVESALNQRSDFGEFLRNTDAHKLYVIEKLTDLLSDQKNLFIEI